MAEYGTGYFSGTSAFWGATGGADWACQLSDERVLVQHPDATGERQFRDWICAFSRQAGQYLDVADAVKNAFRLETAEGMQLDMIGSVVDLPRSGETDARYRTLLDIQIELLISNRPGVPNWTGTINNILRICRKFIGTGVLAPIVLLNTPPYSFVLSVPGVSTSELDVLIRFLCQALYAAVLGQVIVLPSGGGNNLWGSVHGAVTGQGIWCSSHGAVANCALWSHVVVIGADPC
jgi:hypothetical protein